MDRQLRQELGKINAVVMEHCDKLAPYQFLTAFSQLISRVCHSSDEVFIVLMTIVAKVFLAYPQQAMWLMTAVSKVCSGTTLIFFFLLLLLAASEPVWGKKPAIKTLTL